MKGRILLVDDEENILNSIRRNLRGQYELFTALSGREGLELLQREKRIQLVVSDYMMPGMNGVDFLSKVKEILPSTIRIMLTGQADYESVISVINEGNIFRFLSKPCPSELLRKNIDDALEQYRLVNGEKELLTKTLNGTVAILTEILAHTKPAAFNMMMKIRQRCDKVMRYLNLSEKWKIQLASMLSQIGCVIVKDDDLEKAPYVEDRKKMYEATLFSVELISKIPRLGSVADIICYQYKSLDGSGYPLGKIDPESIPVGSKILNVVIDFENYLARDIAPHDALVDMKNNIRKYDNDVFNALKTSVEKNKEDTVVKAVELSELTKEMIFAERIISRTGVLIADKNQHVTQTIITILGNYLEKGEVDSIFKVYLNS
jgi:response regulator RpfG family c-di-GMP phosphodiesterase